MAYHLLNGRPQLYEYLSLLIKIKQTSPEKFGDAACHRGGNPARSAPDSQGHNPSLLPLADSSDDTGSSGTRELPLTNEQLKFTH